ncbi:MAG: phosphate ABC transporter permease PstA [Cyanobacteria bacterium CRU_2_1]|nr:phosphate ABC transporter permease PstA [Cyanobacteria bacterium RU_5_0]NJR57797.1 phosphate ABC transporter permease PstA [Cyanobacteria bacterium CRU_2_1]
MIDSNPLPPEEGQPPRYKPALKRRYQFDRVYATVALIATLLGLLVLLLLLFDVFRDGLPRLALNFPDFLTSFPSRRPLRAGILSPLIGTLWVLVLTMLISIPIGVGAGIFLEEFATESLLAKIIEVNIGNLAAVPTIIYGLLALQVFVRLMEPITGGRSILSGGLTLALLVLPVVIVATREALRAVPDSIRQAGYAIGTTRWQVVRDHVLPIASPGVFTGVILALSRAIGQAAPLITIGALTFIAFLPPFITISENGVPQIQIIDGLHSSFTVLPIQVYNWVSRPQPEFHNAAAAGIIVLMIVLLLMNATAIYLRNRFQQTRY